MHTIDRQMYPYLLEDAQFTYERSMRRLYAWLRKTARGTRFELISGTLFLTIITVYVLTLDMYNVYILSCGVGCILASLALLFTERHPWRKFQALCSMIGNALIISVF
jgi:hypothetical protein